MSEEPDPERVQRGARERQSARADHSESILEAVGRHLGEIEYPVTGEELSAQYSIDEMDLPNETESLGDVFDRLTNEEFASEAEARERIYGELTGEAGGPSEANPERAVQDLDEEAQSGPTESGAEDR
ncbi:hypothetical protein [Salinilacihabitans rarus]|uniref:DUF5789 family protein n=1 Tax=Salinilacihabitans rarus TaxID=2961596 RepID=UPI0020C8CBB3|nr:hypothetical protein [Salinilacihabitans rarus]